MFFHLTIEFLSTLKIGVFYCKKLYTNVVDLKVKKESYWFNWGLNQGDFMEKAEYKPWFLKMNLRDIWKKRAVTCQGEQIM